MVVSAYSARGYVEYYRSDPMCAHKRIEYIEWSGEYSPYSLYSTVLATSTLHCGLEERMGGRDVDQASFGSGQSLNRGAARWIRVRARPTNKNLRLQREEAAGRRGGGER